VLYVSDITLYSIEVELLEDCTVRDFCALQHLVCCLESPYYLRYLFHCLWQWLFLTFRDRLFRLNAAS